MRRIVGAIGIWAVGLAIASGVAPAQGNRAREDPDEARKLEGILKRWEQEGATITQLDATFTRTDRKPEWKAITQYEGRALLKAPNLACLNLEKVNPKAKPRKTFHERILCTGEEVIQYDGPTRQIIIYPLGKDERQRALQQGPLPFLFAMKADQIKKRYRMELMPDEDNAYRIKIIPRMEIDRDAFAEALLDLDRQTYLPRALLLTSANGKETQAYVFKAVETGRVINPANFAFKEIEGWKVVRNPATDERRNVVAGPREPGGADAKARTRPR